MLVEFQHIQNREALISLPIFVSINLPTRKEINMARRVTRQQNPSPNQEQNTAEEVNFRNKLFNSLLKTPHRDLMDAYKDHSSVLEQDPLFYPHLAAWYEKKGEVRDHKELFVITLCLSEHEELRDVGLAMLRKLPPYQVCRVVDFIKGSTKKVATTDKQLQSELFVIPTGSGYRVAKKAERRSAQKMTYREFLEHQYKASDSQVRKWTTDEIARFPNSDKDRKLLLKKGLFRNVPRSMKTEVTRYLHEREIDPAWFDSAVLQAGKHLKRLYQSLRLPRGQRAQRILVENTPPEDSVFFHLKDFNKLEAPADKAKFIAERKIPARTAFTLIPKKDMKPVILLSIVNNMSAQEAFNYANTLKDYGAFEVKDIKELYQEKVKQFSKDKKTSAAKAAFKAPTEQMQQSESAAVREVAESMAKASNEKVQKTIKGRVLLAIDKSSSMSQAIEVGKQLGAMIGASCEVDPIIVVFDSNSFYMKAPDFSIETLNKTFRLVKAGGMTACGSPFSYLIQNNIEVDTVAMVTDGEETERPSFMQGLDHYREKLKSDPRLVFIWVRGGRNSLRPSLNQRQQEFEEFTFEGDYTSLSSIIPLISNTSAEELIQEIMSTPLPKRKAA